MFKTGLGLPCWAPPIFPEGGRLQLTPEQVNDNYKKQIREADDFKNQLSEQAGHRLGFTCSQSLHISLFLMVPAIMKKMIPTLPDHLIQQILPDFFMQHIQLQQKKRDIFHIIFPV